VTYTCDVCEAELPDGYTPQLDHRGRPCLAACTPCNDEIVRERSRRLGLEAADELLDRFAAHLKLVIKPPLPPFCSFVDSPSEGYRMKDKP